MSERQLAMQIEDLSRQIAELQTTLQAEIKARQQVESLFWEQQISQNTGDLANSSTEEPLRENRRKCSLQWINHILNTIADPIFVKNEGHRYLVVNDAFCQLVGYPREQLIGQSDEQIFPEVDLFREQEKRVLALGSPVEYEANFTNAVGNTYVISTKIYCVEDVGAEKFLVGIGREISQQKEMELTMLECQERFLDIMDQAAVGIAQLSLDGQFLWTNSGFGKIVGYSESELLEMKFQDLTHSADLDSSLELCQALINDLIPKFSREKRYIHKNGAVVWGNVTVSLARNHEGKPKYFVAFLTDISDRKRTEQALQDSEHRYYSLMQVSPVGIFHLDASGECVYANPHACEIAGLGLVDMLGEGWIQNVHPEDRLAVFEQLQQIHSDRQKVTGKYRFLRANNQVTWVLSEAIAQFDQDTKITGYVWTVTNINELKVTEEALRQSEEQFRHTFEYAPIGMAIQSLNGPFQRVNQGLCEPLGYTAEELLGKSFADLIHPEEVMAFLEQQQHLLADEIASFQMENRYLAKDGHVVHALLKMVLVRDFRGEPLHLLGQFVDISDRKQVEQQLVHDAFHDALTGLPNRAMFLERVSTALKRIKRYPHQLFAVLFLDVDRFKIVNDSMGPVMGDRLLIAIADKLNQCLRSTDMVARLGGDEFSILLEDIKDIKDATKVADRILELLGSPFTLNGYEVVTTASIGIAMLSPTYEQPEQVLRDADIAMYRAKRAGKARYEIFDKVMYSYALGLLQLENDLRRAIEKREFKLHYQPITSLVSASLTGFEALVRWHHPEKGMVSPVEFIPIAEETGLIVPLGEWVLREACQQMKQWQDQFSWVAPLKMSVNLSAKQLREKQLIQKIDDILLETNLNPNCLKLEITESVLMENTEVVAKILWQLRSRNIELSLDDFGTGYSSLSYLHSFPVNTVKIDRSFVSRMNDNEENSEIVKAIVTLAHTLGMDAVAEGIETSEQLAQLKSLACEQGQGYFFSKPLDSQAATELLANAPTWFNHGEA
ncbi:bifunctional diguanylate cyclase/phosphodiesterase [Planktothricoides raciborskii]|uniref:PAS domain S-box protein n=1 Tax=Planktothricoides raciborskii FACHB-1370 TaxID=2949576 RepID=A0ABR8EAM1_9CYAN|nr:PAS domain S-box protein [Planktothricoides raciborskii]MBD2543768.1 PAS domain S-box protein [Planktothricoides raciborskii FACHB-1370]MBD2582337.1 PAS domain S-box protein [Planktothricoides raciborskii FACHB-1261]